MTSVHTPGPSMAEHRDVYDQRYRSGYRVERCGYEAARAHALRHICRSLAGVDSVRSVLDYGCGSGLFLDVIAESFPQASLHACDVSVEAIEQLSGLASHSGVQVCSRVMDLEESPFDDASFDLVVCVEVLEHVRDVHATVRDIARVLRPGGVCLLTTPCRNVGSIEYAVARLTKRLDRSITGEFRWRWEDPTHLRRMTSRELTSVLESVGLRRAQTRFRAHAMSYLLTPLVGGPMTRAAEWLMMAEYVLCKRVPCGASMIVTARKECMS